MPGKTRKERGVIRPEDVLTREGLMNELGIGRHTVDAMIRSGVKPRYVGNKAMFTGKQVIGWIMSHPLEAGRGAVAAAKRAEECDAQEQAANV